MPQIDSRISLGNIITIVALALPALLAWGALRAETTSHSTTISDHEIRLRIIETKISETLSRIDERLSVIERQVGHGK